MLPEVFRNHICCFQPNTWTSSWGTLSRPSNPSLTRWHHEITTSGSTADRCALKVALMFCSWKRSKGRRASVWFPPSWGHKGVYFWFLPISQLFAWHFFMFGFKTSLVSAIFENEPEEKNMEPRLTPSHNLEEESLFGTWTTFRRWSGILSKSLQERESHAPLRIHSGYSLAFFFFFVIPRSSTWEQHVEFKGADMSQFGSLKACWLSCALHLLHSMHSNISVGQLGVITAHGARMADLGCGTNLHMWDHQRVTELDEKMAKTGRL